MKKLCLFVALVIAMGCKNCDELDFYLHPEVNETQPPRIIPGPEPVYCYPNTASLSISNVQNQTVTWEVSNNLNILRISNSAIEVRAKSSVYGIGIVTAKLSDGTTLSEYLTLNESPHKLMRIEVEQLEEGFIAIEILEGSGVKPYEVYLNNEFVFLAPTRRFQIATSESSGRIEVRNKNLCNTAVNRAFYTGSWKE